MELSELDGFAFKPRYFSVDEIDRFPDMGIITTYIKGQRSVDLKEVVPDAAKGVILKVIVRGLGGKDESGSLVCSDANGNYTAKVAHYYQNGITQYGGSWGGGVIFCPLLTDQSVRYRTMSNGSQTTADSNVWALASPIGWY